MVFDGVLTKCAERMWGKVKKKTATLAVLVLLQKNMGGANTAPSGGGLMLDLGQAPINILSDTVYIGLILGHLSYHTK